MELARPVEITATADGNGGAVVSLAINQSWFDGFRAGIDAALDAVEAAYEPLPDEASEPSE